MRKKLVIVSIGFLLLFCACSYLHPVSEKVFIPGKSSLKPDTDFPFPTFTETPPPASISGFSPTPTFNNLYTNLRYSEEEAKEMNATILNLSDAISKGNTDYVADMVDYPIWVFIDSKKTWIEDKQAFLQNYDQIFLTHFIEVMSNLELNEDYIAVPWNGIYILHDDEISSTEIIFSNENPGKIYRIHYSEIDPNIHYELTPTVTLTAKKPPTEMTVGGLDGYRSPTPTYTPYWFSTTNENVNDFSTYYGTWVITRYESIELPNYNYDENFANSQIGAKITLYPDKAILGKGYQYNTEETEYTHIVYNWIEEDYLGKYFYPLPAGHPDKRDTPLYLDVEIDRLGNLLDIEVLKSGRIMICDGGYWYFLDKVSN